MSSTSILLTKMASAEGGPMLKNFAASLNSPMLFRQGQRCCANFAASFDWDFYIHFVSSLVHNASVYCSSLAVYNVAVSPLLQHRSPRFGRMQMWRKKLQAGQKICSKVPIHLSAGRTIQDSLIASPKKIIPIFQFSVGYKNSFEANIAMYVCTYVCMLVLDRPFLDRGPM
jgi:hypothetical protein